MDLAIERSADFNDLDNSAASICLINLTNAAHATNVTNKFDIKLYFCLYIMYSMIDFVFTSYNKKCIQFKIRSKIACASEISIYIKYV